MNLTNERNLPEALVAAVHRDNYDRGTSDFTVTELCTPPRIVQLRRKHKSEIVEDASDRIFSLVGQAIHGILERAAGERYIVEKRYAFETDQGSLSGRIDLYDRETQVLSDYKVTSRYSIQDGPKDDWIFQANINRFLMINNDVPVKSMQIVAILRDWSKIQVARGRNDYPEKQVVVLPIPMWPLEQTLGFINERMALHIAARTKLPECTVKERWQEPPRFALMKKGRKRAVKLYESEEEAVRAVSEPSSEFIEGRPSVPVRCQHYCDCLPWCVLGRELVAESVGM